MRTYEALFIVRPELPEEEVQTVASAVESLVTEHGGAIVRSEIWGKRRLAYEVNKLTEGIYVLIRFEAGPEFPKVLERHFRLSEAIIRYLVKYYDEKELRLEAEQVKRTEAELAKAALRERTREGSDRPERGERGGRRHRDDDDDD